MDKTFLVVHKKILPDIFEKVLETKKLLRIGKARGITEATQMTGISRSTFYKYKDFISTPSEMGGGQKATITLLLDHTPGILSKLLNVMANISLNILTINQDIPINGIAHVSITLDRARCDFHMDKILETIEEIEGISKVELIGME
ncbi:ACT domain-containing protein [Lutibacter sp. B2]|nr:ACT domain-containing protein [Lutibacter sp. B2]